MIPDTERQRIVSDYRSGLTINAFAGRYRKATRTVTRVLELAGVLRLRKRGEKRKPVVNRRAVRIAQPVKRNAAKGISVRECRAPWIEASRELPHPYPCIKHDMTDDACAKCEQRYRMESIVAGASSGWTLENVGRGR